MFCSGLSDESVERLMRSKNLNHIPIHYGFRHSCKAFSAEFCSVVMSQTFSVQRENGENATAQSSHRRLLTDPLTNIVLFNIDGENEGKKKLCPRTVPSLLP